MNIFEFADIIGKDINITYYANQDGRFCVSFEDCSVMSDGFLTSAHGNGYNIPDAIEDYLKDIRGTKIVFNPYSRDRQEYNIPESITIE